jgi:hypothetical protein
MATIAVSQLLVDEDAESTSETVQLQILVKDEDWAGLFNQIEVWRSRDTVSGPYEELTADSWKRARIPKTAGDEPSSPVDGASVIISGEVLQFLVNEQDTYVVTISGVDPLTFAEVAAQVVAQGQGRLDSYVDSNGVFVVETTEPGTGAILRVEETDGAAVLALPTSEPECLAYGRDARISLKTGTEEYLFTDVRGDSTYWYKTRFRNKLTQAVSEFSQPYSVGQALGISRANIVCGQLDLVGLDGKPVAYREVSVYPSNLGELIEDKLVVGPSQLRATDSNGHVEFLLVRGSTVTVAISGTSIVRDIEVPTDATVSVFGLLEASVGPVDDVFVVNRPDIVYASRRSL